MNIYSLLSCFGIGKKPENFLLAFIYHIFRSWVINFIIVSLLSNSLIKFGWSSFHVFLFFITTLFLWRIAIKGLQAIVILPTIIWLSCALFIFSAIDLIRIYGFSAFPIIGNDLFFSPYPGLHFVLRDIEKLSSGQSISWILFIFYGFSIFIAETISKQWIEDVNGWISMRHSKSRKISLYPSLLIASFFVFYLGLSNFGGILTLLVFLFIMHMLMMSEITGKFFTFYDIFYNKIVKFLMTSGFWKLSKKPIQKSKTVDKIENIKNLSPIDLIDRLSIGSQDFTEVSDQSKFMQSSTLEEIIIPDEFIADEIAIVKLCEVMSYGPNLLMFPGAAKRLAEIARSQTRLAKVRQSSFVDMVLQALERYPSSLKDAMIAYEEMIMFQSGVTLKTVTPSDFTTSVSEQQSQNDTILKNNHLSSFSSSDLQLQEEIHEVEIRENVTEYNIFEKERSSKYNSEDLKENQHNETNNEIDDDDFLKPIKKSSKFYLDLKNSLQDSTLDSFNSVSDYDPEHIDEDSEESGVYIVGLDSSDSDKDSNNYSSDDIELNKNSDLDLEDFEDINASDSNNDFLFSSVESEESDIHNVSNPENFLEEEMTLNEKSEVPIINFAVPEITGFNVEISSSSISSDYDNSDAESDTSLMDRIPSMSVIETEEIAEHLSGIYDNTTDCVDRLFARLKTLQLEGSSQALLSKLIKGILSATELSSSGDKALSFLFGMINLSEVSNPDKHLAKSKLTFILARRYRRERTLSVSSLIKKIKEETCDYALEQTNISAAIHWLKHVLSIFPSKKIISVFSEAETESDIFKDWLHILESFIQKSDKKFIADSNYKSSRDIASNLVLEKLLQNRQAFLDSMDYDVRALVESIEDMRKSYEAARKVAVRESIKNQTEMSIHPMMDLANEAIVSSKQLLTQLNENSNMRKIIQYLKPSVTSINFLSEFSQLLGEDFYNFYSASVNSNLKSKRFELDCLKEDLLLSRQAELVLKDQITFMSDGGFGLGSSDPIDAILKRSESLSSLIKDGELNNSNNDVLYENSFPILHSLSLKNEKGETSKLLVYSHGKKRDLISSYKLGIIPFYGMGLEVKTSISKDNDFIISASGGSNFFSLSIFTETFKKTLLFAGIDDLKILLICGTLEMESRASGIASLTSADSWDVDRTTVPSGLDKGNIIILSDLESPGFSLAARSGFCRSYEQILNSKTPEE